MTDSNKSVEKIEENGVLILTKLEKKYILQTLVDLISSCYIGKINIYLRKPANLTIKEILNSTHKDFDEDKKEYEIEKAIVRKLVSE